MKDVLESGAEVDILGVEFDSKLSMEYHVVNPARQSKT